MVFLIVSIIVFNVIAWFMPKRITKSEMYCSVLFSAVFQLLADVYLGVKHDLYGYFTKDIDYLTLLVIFGIFPALNLIYLNFFPMKNNMKKKAAYILLWSAFSVVYEWGTVVSGYFYYSGWKLWWSVLCYPPIYVILVAHLYFLRWLQRKEAAG